MSEIAHPRSFELSVHLPAPQNAVFDYLDDFEHLGAHMTRSSWMMAGSRMRYEFDASRGREPGGQIRILGTFLGYPLEIVEQVVERVPPREKSWSTIGPQRMLILAACRLGFTVTPTPGGSNLNAFIDYAIPPSGAGRLMGRMFAGMYARWCVRSVLAAATSRFGRMTPTSVRSGGPSSIASISHRSASR